MLFERRKHITPLDPKHPFFMHRVNESLIHTLYKITHVAIILFVILLVGTVCVCVCVYKRTSSVNDPWLERKLHETRKIIVHICMKLNNIKLIMMLKINITRNSGAHTFFSPSTF